MKPLVNALIVILTFISHSIASAQASTNSNIFKLTGHITGLPDGEIYLAYGSMSKMKADTVLAKNGDFIFDGKITEPCYAMLFNHNYSVKIDLFLDAGNIAVKANIDSLYDANVKGSFIVNEYAAYNQSLLDTRKPVQVIYEQWMKAYNDKDSVAAEKYKAAFTAARDIQMKQSGALQVAFMKQHPASYASAWELMHYISNKTLDESKVIFQSFTATIQQSEQGKEVAERIATLSRITVGQKAPAFIQKSVADASISLDAYKGKYVLLEFWASWCGPCRAESPNLLKAYQQYKDKGFDVLSVSLDDKKDKWIDAIKKDGIPWMQVSDLKGWKNEVAVLYGINGVPANFLIDPNGKIIEQDLRGEKLQQALQKIFTQQN
jgi:peroxiredoxin